MIQPKKLPFRFDINALRAVAVLSVVLYHFQVPGFGGGFVGVDVFFVISGFLMTQIIYGQLSENRFSLAAFYIAPMRRIVPALILLSVVLLLCGYFFLIPFDYEILGKRVLTSLTFVSNIALLHKAPYFDPASREQWLLHTWSLSVEAQFYLLWPFLLMGLQRNRKFVKPSVIVIFISSLAWCILRTQHEASAAFYSLPTRVWEFTAGGMIYLFRQHLSLHKNLSLIGLLFILLAVFFYSGDLAYPGHWAFLPVAGAALFMVAQSESALIKSRGIQFFGDISYSLYLWHWPVVVGAKYLDMDFTPLNLLCLISLSIMLAYISFKYIEKPLRYKLDWGACLAGGASVALAAYLIFTLQGLSFRVPENVLQAQNVMKDADPRENACMFIDGKKPLPECHLGAAVKPSVAIWGDSHADALFTVLDKSLTNARRSALYYSYQGCPPVLGAILVSNTFLREDDRCRAFNERVKNRMISQPNIKDILIISRWSFYLDGGINGDTAARSQRVVFDKVFLPDAANLPARSAAYAAHIVDTMCTLTKNGKNVYVVAPIPEMDRAVPAALAKSRMLWHKDGVIEASLKDYAVRQNVVLKALSAAQYQCHVHILDPKPYLCDKVACFALKDGQALYKDDNHLSLYGGSFLEKMFMGAWR